MGIEIRILSSEDRSNVPVPESALHMLYVQGTAEDRRHQWIYIPRGDDSLGMTAFKDASGLLLSRLQERVGHRTMWRHQRLSEHRPVEHYFRRAATKGFALSGVTVVPLEQDDYIGMWDGKTSHKALRAVARTLATQGISLK